MIQKIINSENKQDHKNKIVKDQIKIETKKKKIINSEINNSHNSNSNDINNNNSTNKFFMIMKIKK